MNLNEQQNILRGMPDEALKQAIQGQSGLPPYLVLTEIQRRKSARERFNAMDQRQKAANTVAEELVGGRIPAPTVAAPQGIEALMASGAPGAAPGPVGLEAAMPQQTAFADGGAVGYAPGGQITLQDILAKLSNYGVDQEAAKQDAITMAMLQASAAMLSNGSSNTFKNIGAGISAAAPAYQTAMKDARANDMALLNAQAGVIGDINPADRAEADRALRMQELNQQALYQQGMLENAATPDDAKRVEWAQKQFPNDPVAQQDFILQPQVAEAQKQYQIVLAEYIKSIPDTDKINPEKYAAAVAQAQALAHQFLSDNFGSDVIARVGTGVSGITPGPNDTVVDLSR